MKMKGSAYFYIVIMIFSLAILIAGVRMEYFATRLLPLVFGALGFILAAIGFIQEVLGKGKPEKATGAKEKDSSGRGSYLTNGVWAVGLALGILMLGFTISTPLFLLLYTRWLGTRWLTGLISAVVTTALIYGVFQVALQVELYPGLVFKWLGVA